MNKNDLNCCVLGILISIACSIFVALIIITFDEDFINKDICNQLYTQTQNYKQCMTHGLGTNIKLIKSIDKE